MLVKAIQDELKAEIPADDKAGEAKKKLAHYYELCASGCSASRSRRSGCGRIIAHSTRFVRFRLKLGVLPRTHGSALFTRGETQALVTATLGTTDDSQRLETFEGEQRKTVHAPLQLPAVFSG